MGLFEECHYCYGKGRYLVFKITLLSFCVCFLVERIFVGWNLPKVHSWYTRVILVNAVQLIIIVTAGFTWEHWLSSFSIFHLSNSLSPGLAGFAAYFIATFVFYWWHRLRHDNDFLWRHFHQIHHSPQRLEVITSFYKHPLEMVVNSLIGSVIVYTLLGLTLEAGAIYTLFTALGEFFYHTNIKTPRWIGFVFQRPEMHRVHHQFNRHKNNYGDFVFWDMMFGTYENPKTWTGQCGFTEQNELRLKDMLFFKDVHQVGTGICVLLGIFLCSQAFASTHRFSSWDEACSTAAQDVREGDLIFTDIPTLPFRKVASTTNSWTSHVGIVFLGNNGQWIVSQSKIPLSRDTPLCDFLKASSRYRFEIKRLNRPLEYSEILEMRKTAKSLLGQWYSLSFKLDSKFLFCSKFTYLVYRSINIQVGEIQTFRDLLRENPNGPISFWKAWYLGSIPWNSRTVTPASQLRDSQFTSVLEAY